MFLLCASSLISREPFVSLPLSFFFFFRCHFLLTLFSPIFFFFSCGGGGLCRGHTNSSASLHEDVNRTLPFFKWVVGLGAGGVLFMSGFQNKNNKKKKSVDPVFQRDTTHCFVLAAGLNYRCSQTAHRQHSLAEIREPTS